MAHRLHKVVFGKGSNIKSSNNRIKLKIQRAVDIILNGLRVSRDQLILNKEDYNLCGFWFYQGLALLLPSDSDVIRAGFRVQRG